MQSNEIILRNLSKSYGQMHALKNVTLTIGPGMFGLLGRNGAGKTTLMRILTTLLPKSGGEAILCGVPIEKAGQIRRLVGYLPQEFSLYPQVSVYEAMEYLGVLSGLTGAERKARILPLLSRVNLEDAAKLKVRALSGGMRRRLGIAQALLHDPRILIVDEPTAGLDPEERVRFRTLLTDLAQDRIVLLSTHIVEDIEKACENIAILVQGSLLYQGSLASFIGDASGLEEAYMAAMGGIA